MKRYATITEVKNDLPNILDRIKCCKLYYDIASLELKTTQDLWAAEADNPGLDFGWLTSPKLYAETFRNQMLYLAEIEYLQGLLKKLPEYKDRDM